MDFRKAVSITTEEFDSHLASARKRSREKDKIKYPRFNEVLRIMELGDAIKYPCSWEHRGNYCMGKNHVNMNAVRIRKNKEQIFGQVNSTSFSTYCHEGNLYVKRTA